MKMHSVPALVSLIILLCFTSCQQPPPPPIKIGLSVNLTGIGGTAGGHIRDGALLAVEHINAAGGINGRPLELFIRDDQNNDEGIEKADLSLINEQVVAIIGHSYSSNTVKAYPLVISRDTLLITAYTATTQLSGKDDLFIRTSVDCALYGKKTVELLRQHDVSSIAFLMDMTNSNFVLDFVDHVKKGFSGSVHEVKFKSREHVDWNSVINELLAPHPDAIIFLTEASMTGVALQKLHAEDYKGLRVASLWTQAPSLMRYAGPAAEGLSIVTYIDPDNQRKEYLEFSKKMQERFNQPANARSTRSYEIVMILANALKRSEEVDAYLLKKALLAEEYETLMGKMKFDRFGDVVRPVYEVVVRNGRFTNSGEI